MEEVKEVVVDPAKKIIESNTMRANALVVVIMVLQVVTGAQLLDPEVQALLVALLNIFLRFQTKVPIR